LWQRLLNNNDFLSRQSGKLAFRWDTDDPTATRYGRLLAWYCRLGVSQSVCLSVTKYIVVKRDILQQKCQNKWIGNVSNNFQPHISILSPQTSHFQNSEILLLYNISLSYHMTILLMLLSIEVIMGDSSVSNFVIVNFIIIGLPRTGIKTWYSAINPCN